jgi:lipopolysaccharide transport system ATP-binding protein
LSAVISIEKLSKRYCLGNQQYANYAALRDSLSTGFKNVFSNTKIKESNELWALKDIDLTINKGERFGIIGRNGAGKSTLLKILTRITEPTSGSVKMKGKVASLLEVGTGFHPELTGRENIFLNGAILGMTRSDIKSQFDAIVDFAETEQFLDTPVKRYSSGMYVRLAFAVAAHLNPDILIVDEVLAVGDLQFQKKCLGKMKEVSDTEGRTVLFVSHNLSSIIDLCDKAILLDKGRLKSYGNANEIVKDYLSVQTNNIFRMERELLEVKCQQQDDQLIIDVVYDTRLNLDVPHFGFVVKNALGIPVLASNPSIEQLDYKENNYPKAGKINIVITEPKLFDGVYSLSVWFGNSYEESVKVLDALTFEVAGMSNKKQHDFQKVGSVVPITKWKFYN